MVDRADVRAVGMDRRAVQRRVKAELMHPLFPGVWAWGHRAITREAWFLAAVLSVGARAMLCGASACQLYGLLGRRIGRIHVLSDKRRRNAGRLIVHHADPLPARRRRKGIPVVPVEEALLGLAADETVSDHDVRRAIRQAQVEKLTSHAKLVAHARRSVGRPGIRRFRDLVGDRPAPTKSELEDAALALLRRYDFDPVCNVLVDGERADVVVGGVILELDSEAFHDNSVSAANDARRHEVWQANRRRTRRWTWDDVHVTPVRTIRRLRAAIASPG